MQKILAVLIDCEDACCGKCPSRHDVEGDEYCGVFGQWLTRIKSTKKVVRCGDCRSSEIKPRNSN